MDKTVYEAQKRYTDKNLRNGQRRVNLWVPEKHVEELKNIASRMRTGQHESV